MTDEKFDFQIEEIRKLCFNIFPKKIKDLQKEFKNLELRVSIIENEQINIIKPTLRNCVYELDTIADGHQEEKK